jgi:hypothetical protein
MLGLSLNSDICYRPIIIIGARVIAVLAVKINK